MFEGIYYAGPQEFNPVNAAYLQLHEELVEQSVNDACDYIRNTYGNDLTKAQMEQVFEDFDIEYPLLPSWMKDKFDLFNITDY